ncbi:hypothetical protein HNP29_000964 [Pseudomonas alcaligenes]|nr:hypothetical protein [Pseudomonas alcaligenes]
MGGLFVCRPLGQNSAIGRVALRGMVNVRASVILHGHLYLMPECV